jgi:hypothetical protein
MPLICGNGSSYSKGKTMSETPRYRVHNRPTTNAAGGLVERGEIIETEQTPNQFFAPLNVEAFRRVSMAGLNPLAWKNPEALAIAEELRKAG